MLKWAIIFFVISLVAGFFGFSGVAAGIQVDRQGSVFHRTGNLPRDSGVRRVSWGVGVLITDRISIDCRWARRAHREHRVGPFAPPGN